FTRGALPGDAPSSVSIRYDGFESVDLNGGKADDTFQINGTGLAPAIRIDGGGGVNTLDYSSVTQGVVVNLPLGTANGLTGGIANFGDVFGGSGNDILVGNAAANTLRGGAGRDLLIGGAGLDTVDGGGGEDILMAGGTAYELDPAALAAGMAEWARTDLPYAS